MPDPNPYESPNTESKPKKFSSARRLIYLVVAVALTTALLIPVVEFSPVTDPIKVRLRLAVAGLAMLNLLIVVFGNLFLKRPG